ncbi:MAG: sterol desaturase family protein [Microscillaceae bacterium]
MDFNPIIFSIPLFFFLMGIELMIDQYRKTGLYRLNDSITNLNAGSTQQVFKIVVALGFYEFFYHNFALFHIEWSVWSFLLLFVLDDFCYYWAHRVSHEVNLFWSGHVVHHQSEEYNLSVALRQSWLQAIFTFWVYVPLAILGFDTYMMAWVGAINLTYQFWIHTETVGKMGILEYVLNTPSHHRVHHGRNPKYIDKNYAGVFIIWDRMFGTFQEEEERPVYGITRPLNSWNPVWANFSNFQTIYEQWKQVPGFWDKMKVLFYKPGWRPAALGGPIPVPEVSRQHYVKYDTYTPLAVNLYAFFQYLLITAGVLAFMLHYGALPLVEKLVAAALIMWAVIHNGALFERRRWVYYADYGRMLLSLLFVGYVLRHTDYFHFINGLSLFLLLVSFVWLYLLRNAFLKGPLKSSADGLSFSESHS